ncbi:MAG: class I SAM-dependent methyltransferase [Dehalococcoidia bacterium]
MDFGLMPIKGGERVLDLGCGPGRHTWYVCKLDHCSVYAVDYDLESLQKAKYMLCMMDAENETKGKWTVLMGNALTLPFSDKSFDKIVCSEVLEHVLDDGQAVRELLRVLKDDGELAVSVPTYLPETIYWKLSEAYHTNPGGHIRIYKERLLIDMLQRNNLNVYAVRHKHAFHSIYWLLRCIFGVRNEKALIPAIYHKFLAWQIDSKSGFWPRLEGFFDHLFPKSVVVYLHKAPNVDSGA